MLPQADDPLVNVFRQWQNKDPDRPAVFPRAWPKHSWDETKPCAEVMRLSRALTTGFKYPAYLVAYAPNSTRRRLSKEVLSEPATLAKCGGFVQMHLFICDVDGPSHNSLTESQEDLIEAWWLQEKSRIGLLLETHPGLYVYRSRGGYRIVGRLARMIHLSSPVGATAWTDRYVSWINYLNRRFGIKTHGKETADKLGDFTRLQRVPHDSRDFDEPDQLEVIGDTSAPVGLWDPQLEPIDIPVKREAKPNHSVSSDTGALLVQLVQNRGLRCEQINPTEYDICCPRYQLHSPNAAGERDYPGKTHLFTGQGRLGGIKCFSDGCTAAHANSGDWVDEFSWQEKLLARRQLGQTKLKDPLPMNGQQLRIAGISENVIAILSEGKDDSKPDKTVQQCIHQVACAMLRAGCLPENVLGVLTDDCWELSKHVLLQTDPAWYVDERLTQAVAALEEARALEENKETLSEEETISQAYNRLFSFSSRARGAIFGDDDADLATMAVAMFGPYRCRRIVTQGDTWVIRKNHVWEYGENGHVRNMLREFGQCIDTDLRNIKAALKGAGRANVFKIWKDRTGNTEEMEDEEIIEHMKFELNLMADMVHRLKSTSGLNAIATLVGDSLMVTPDDLDKNTDQIVFKNVMWDAASGRFCQNRPETFATLCIPIEWKVPCGAAQNGWRQYLETLGFDDDTLGFLQRFLGYTMLGRGTEKRFGWFRGGPDCSKSTLIEIIARCLGSYARTTLTSMWLHKSSSQSGHTDELAGLRAIRFVYADEFPKVSRFDDALMKKVTSGMGELAVSFKGKSGFRYRVSFTPFFASNYDPQISEDDLAFLGRLTTLTFKNKITKKDPRFVDKLLGQEDMQCAVIDWLMAGAMLYIRDGLGAEPAQVMLSRKEFTQDQVSIEDQLAEIITAEAGSRISITIVMTRLAEHQNRTRQRSIFTLNQLKKIVCDKFGAKVDINKGIQCFIGISLRPTRFDSRDESVDPDADYTPSDIDKFDAPGF